MPLLRSLILLVVILGLAGAARADNESSRALAKRLKDEGAAAIERGDQALGLDRYREAYRVFPSPNMLFNIAMALERLGRLGEALTEYEAFLNLAGAAPHNARVHANSRAAALKGRVGDLAISADLDGATVTVDGRAAGVTPLPRSVHVDPGEHRVEARRDGYQVALATASVVAGQTAAVTLHLVATTPPATATATTTATPPTATVTVTVTPTVPGPTVTTPLATVPARPTPSKAPRRGWVAAVVLGGVVLGGGAVALGVTVGTRNALAPTYGTIDWP